jgi:hypothetical protein
VALTVTGIPLQRRLKSRANAVGLSVLPFFSNKVSNRRLNAEGVFVGWGVIRWRY